MRSKILVSCFLTLCLITLLSAPSLAVNTIPLTGTGDSTTDANAIQSAVNSPDTIVQLSGTFNLGDNGANGPRRFIKLTKPNVTR